MANSRKGTKAKVGKPGKSVTAAKANQSKKSRKSSDFVMTISDSDNNVDDLDDDSDDSDNENSKESKEGEQKRSKDLNDDFEFSLNGFTIKKTADDGWDFEIAESTRKSVDLEKIIKEHRGDEFIDTKDLTDKKKDDDEDEEDDGEEDEVDDEDEDEDDEEDEDEEDEDEEDEATDGEMDDDELALDGFGGGAEEEEEEEEEEVEEDENDEQESDDKEDNDIQEESAPVDTAEEIAEFYETPETENTDSIHKTFQTLNLSRPIMKGIADLGYTSPSPIQRSTIPVALMGKDIVAGAITGSGKTAAFLIPIIERLLYRPKKVASTRVVVLVPTRELAIQVADVGKKLGKYVGGLRFGLAVGGLNLRVQEQELKSRPDIVVATPGRFIDHVRNSPTFTVETVEILVVDEADRMLEEGFQKELTEILTLIPSKRQTMLFSATMNNSIKDLIQLSLHKPVRLVVNPPKQAASGLVQEFVRIRKRTERMKAAVLAFLLQKIDVMQRVIVFVARKEEAHRLRVILGLLGKSVGELHGSLTQEQRLKSVTEFKNLKVPVLICTDLASRGLDIPKIEVVINYDMPKSHEVYLHRVGRTARAGREGRSITLVGEATAERAIVKDAMKSAGATKSKIVARNVDWEAVGKIQANIDSKEDAIAAVLEQEQAEKLLNQAERDLKKGENLIKHENEIKSRPKRTWFESEAEKKEAKKPKLNRKQKKVRETQDSQVSYHKTAKDRSLDRRPAKAKRAEAKASNKTTKKTLEKIKRAKKYKQ